MARPKKNEEIPVEEAQEEMIGQEPEVEEAQPLNKKVPKRTVLPCGTIREDH